MLVSAWHHNRRGNQPGLKQAGFDAFLDETASRWSQMVRRARETGPSLGSGYLEIRYEDLAEDPERILERVLNHLGADAGEDIVRSCVDAASFEKLSKGRTPGEEDNRSFFRKGIANDWQNHMSAAQVERFNARSGGLLQELGYATSSSGT